MKISGWFTAMIGGALVGFAILDFHSARLWQALVSCGLASGCLWIALDMSIRQLKQ